ncbi:uncharacterized protein LOC144547865 [Carex rostrata]
MKLSVDPNAAQPNQPAGSPGDPQPIRSLAPGGVVRQSVGPGGHMVSVVYLVQMRAQALGGSSGQLRTSALQSCQNTQSSLQSAGTGCMSSLVSKEGIAIQTAEAVVGALKGVLSVTAVNSLLSSIRAPYFQQLSIFFYYPSKFWLSSLEYILIMYHRYMYYVCV